MSNDIHIAPGPTSPRSIERVKKLKAGQCLTNWDKLSNGPLPRVQSLEEWFHVRDQYWLTLNPEADRDLAFISSSDLAIGIESLRDAKRIVLWVGTSTAEQILLAWMVQFFRAVNIDPTRLHVIQFDHEALKWRGYVEIGCLDRAQLKAHPPATALSPKGIAEIEAAWEAVTSPGPEELVAFVSEPQDNLRFLRVCLRSLLYHYPDIRTGLNRFEEELLRRTNDEGPGVGGVIGHTMGYSMGFPDWADDFYLFDRLRRLADPKLPHPFLTMTGSKIQMGDTSVELTEFGAKALDGSINFVELNGIDDWVGGVHLNSSAGKVWYRDGETLVQA